MLLCFQHNTTLSIVLLSYFTNISMLCLFWQLLPDVDSMKSFQLFKICIAFLSRRCIYARVL